jgi:glycosyltransferase involved in cell wall biosynthesis
MIVKNEANTVLRCLDSVGPLVDFVLVGDTGSTDGTQRVIRDWLDKRGIAGEVFDEPWRDFAYNRSVGLARLRRKAEVDYAFVMDADDVLLYDPDFDPVIFKSILTADIYNISIIEGSVHYARPLIFRNRLEFCFRGVIHEFLQRPPGDLVSETAAGLRLRSYREGARSRDPNKYRNDALLLGKALEMERDPFMRSRYTFYLGQSWRDFGDHEKALNAYLKRTELGFWDEEIFLSWYYAANLKERLSHPGFEIVGMFLRAYETCPWRAESLHGAARYSRATGQFHQGYMLARHAVDIPQPPAGLFVESWIYEYGLLDELAVNAYWVGRHRECLEVCERLLIEAKFPGDMRERVEANANFARDKLGIPRSHTPPAASKESWTPARPRRQRVDGRRFEGSPRIRARRNQPANKPPE